MKVFGWIQSKLKYGRQDESNHIPKPKSLETVTDPGKEDVNEWLHGLLAIGTFGKNDMFEDLQSTGFHGNVSSSCRDQTLDSVSEEVGTVEDDFDSLLRKQDDHESVSAFELEKLLQLQRQLSDKTHRLNEPNVPKEPGVSIVPSRRKDVSVDSKKNNIGKKSLTFLLKKILVCRSGFALPPSPKASILESRTEKIFRAMLDKKIHPQSSCPSMSAKKYLENRNTSISNSIDDDMVEEANQGSKWVKTDSEYIVLEM